MHQIDNPHDINTYGYAPQDLIKDKRTAEQRLISILGDPVMRFNPYSVVDTQLLACADRAVFRPFPALTQMVIIHFDSVLQGRTNLDNKRLSFRIGDNSNQYTMPMASLMWRSTYRATRQPVRSTVNGTPITSEKTVERKIGKTYFVSHALMGVNVRRWMHPVYRMFRLKGEESDRAKEIRLRMVLSKIEMLQEVLKYPYSPDYLNCARNLFDYTTPILQYIELIRKFLPG